MGEIKNFFSYVTISYAYTYAVIYSSVYKVLVDIEYYCKIKSSKFSIIIKNRYRAIILNNIQKRISA